MALFVPDQSICLCKMVLRLAVDRTATLTHSLRDSASDSKLTMNTRLLILALAIPITVPADAQTAGSPLSPLFDCRQITDDAQRLACLDSAVDLLHEAENSGDVIAIYRGDIEAAEEATYGLDVSGLRLPGLPDLGLSGGTSTDLASAAEAGTGADDASSSYQVERNDDGEITRIEGLPIRTLQHDNVNRLVVTLQNGQVWRQADGNRINYPRRQPPTEMFVTVRSGTLGSHHMQLNGRGRWFRVRREQ